MRLEQPVTMTLEGDDLSAMLTEAICKPASPFESLEVGFVVQTEDNGFRVDLVPKEMALKARREPPTPHADVCDAHAFGGSSAGSVNEERHA